MMELNLNLLMRMNMTHIGLRKIIKRVCLIIILNILFLMSVIKIIHWFNNIDYSFVIES